MKGLLNRVFKFSLVCMLGLAVKAQASTLEQADELFAKRGGASDEGDVAACEEAAKAYEQLIANKSVQGDDVVYAAEQIARLRAFQIALTPITEKEKRIQLADSGLNALKNISKASIQKDVPEFLYWTALLTVRRAQAEGEAVFLKYIRQVFLLIDTGDKVAPNYEGGGFKRLRGQVLAKLPVLLGGNPGKAETNFEAASNAEPYENDRSEFREYEKGSLFYSLHYYRAENFCRGLYKKDEALKVFATVNQMIADDNISPKRSPETKLDIKLLKELEKEIQASNCK